MPTVLILGLARTSRPANVWRGYRTTNALRLVSRPRTVRCIKRVRFVGWIAGWGRKKELQQAVRAGDPVLLRRAKINLPGLAREPAFDALDHTVDGSEAVGDDGIALRVFANDQARKPLHAGLL